MCQKYSGAKASCPCSRVRAAYFAHKNIVLPRCWGEESIKCFKRLKKGRKVCTTDLGTELSPGPPETTVVWGSHYRDLSLDPTSDPSPF